MLIRYDIAVIGAGPAGMIAAIFAAKNGSKVVLLEKNNEIGKKLLATGNGRCNLTNKNITIDRYHGLDVYFAVPILDSFDASETIKFFESIGVTLKEEDLGRMFPRTDQASTVVDALRRELQIQGVVILTDFTVKKIIPSSLSSLVANPGISSVPSVGDPRFRKDDNVWKTTGEGGQEITATRLILTTGGKAAHMFGSSGDGLFWAKNMGHTEVPIHAALVPIETKEDFVKEIMGIKLVTKTSLVVNGKTLERRSGDLLFTHFGISGPAAMGLAGKASQLLSDGKEVIISIDMLPDVSLEELDASIMQLLSEDGKKSIKTIVSGLVPTKLALKVLSFAGINESIKAAEISKIQRQAIIRTLKDFRLTASKVRPLKEAQVTSGGITTTEIDENLQSKIVPNLYFAGEILDIDGDSGGFNLQWAWSSGKIAGESAARKL